METQIKFVVGSRKLFSVPRQLSTISFTLGQILSGTAPDFPPLEGEQQGYRILSAPQTMLDTICRTHPDCIVGGLQSYRRFYIDMEGSYEEYLSGFSSKTRANFRRKKRKLDSHCGGTLEMREYRDPSEISEFLSHALPLSQLTYQTRLLDAGLPESDSARATMMELAAQNQIRAFLLFASGKPISYLYLPIDDSIINYAFLGYDPDIANFSPGTILQLDALEKLFAEQRYRYFDFTEGEGAHKKMFGTDSVEACSFMLLKGSLANRALLGSLDKFDGAVAAAKNLAERGGISARVRRVLKN